MILNRRTYLNTYRCQREVFVDRAEYEEATVITCPLPQCTHSWCKQCSRSVEIGGPQHHCSEGIEALERLMGARGWKRCPGLKSSSKISNAADVSPQDVERLPLRPQGVIT